MSVHFDYGPATANRCYIINGAAGVIFALGVSSFGSPSVGRDIDGVSSVPGWIPAHPGAVTHVEASAAFSAGAVLATIAAGRVRTPTAGECGVLRALTPSTLALLVAET